MKEESFDNQSATKGDVSDLRSELKADICDVKNELKSSTEKLNKKIDDLGEDLRNFKSEVVASFKELGEAIQLFATNVDSRFNKVEGDITQIKSTMVTKDYLDEKMGDLRGDMTVLIRKEDNKVKALVEVLVEKNVLNQNDQKRIFSLEPFAQ